MTTKFVLGLVVLIALLLASWVVYLTGNEDVALPMFLCVGAGLGALYVWERRR